MDDFNITPFVYTETFFNKEGKECVDNNKCYAKTIDKQREDKESTTHYVLCNMSAMVDPWGDDCSQRKIVEQTFKKVPAECFRLYLKYLKTRETRFLTIARRKQNG